MNIDNLPAKIVGMPAAEYFAATKFDSRSFLLHCQRYGGEGQLWLEKGRPLFSGNAGTSFGSIFDSVVTGLLEGKRLSDIVVVAPEEVLGANGSRSTKAYKEWAAAQTAIIVTEDQIRTIESMLASMRGNDSSFGLMSATTETQVSVFFEYLGHRLKVRPDACTSALWWDLKTTSHTWDRIANSVMDYGYAEQAWLYTEGAKSIGYSDFRMPFVFVQTVAPYGCRVYTLPEELVERAGQRLVGTMEEVRLRRSTGSYMPVDANEITELAMPAWAMRKEEAVAI
jgi:hypothetical protein